MRAFLVLSFLAVFASPAIAEAADLSDGAAAIVERVGENGDANEICKSKDDTRDAVRAAVEELRDEDALEGRPRPQAMQAAKHIMDDCGSL